MPRKNEDTVPVCVRMPRGAVERLRHVTGMPFSTLARLVLMKALLRAEAAQVVPQVDNVADLIGEAVQEVQL